MNTWRCLWCDYSCTTVVQVYHTSASGISTLPQVYMAMLQILNLLYCSQKFLPGENFRHVHVCYSNCGQRYCFCCILMVLCFVLIICRCYVCQQTKTVEIDRGRIAEPAVCPNCQTLHSMALIHNRSSFNDKQMVKLQESPDDMPPGQTPHTIVVYAHHDLVDSVQPGDRWER